MKILVSASGLSPILFHAIPINSLVSAILDNSLIFTPTSINKADGVAGTEKAYFLSCTRSRDGAYHRKFPSGALITLDGRKLGQTLKGKAIDYWGLGDVGDTSRAHNNEMEDRVFSDKPAIKFSSYVTEISMLAPRLSKQQALNISLFCRRNGIGLFVYNEADTKAFLYGNKKKAVSIQNFMSEPNKKVDQNLDRLTPEELRYHKLRKLKPRKDDVLSDLSLVLNKVSDPNYNLYLALRDGDLKTKTNLDRWISSYPRDLLGQLDATFHNSGRASFAKDSRKQLDRVLLQMRKLNLTTAKELGDFLLSRADSDWKKSREAI